MTARADDLAGQLHVADEALAGVETQQRELASRLGDEERALTRITSELDKLRTDNEQSRAAHLEKLRAAATLGNRISALEAHCLATQAAFEQGSARLAELNHSQSIAAAEYAELAPRLEQLSTAAAAEESLLRPWKPDSANCAASIHEPTPNWPLCANATAEPPNATPCSTS